MACCKIVAICIANDMICMFPDAIYWCFLFLRKRHQNYRTSSSSSDDDIVTTINCITSVWELKALRIVCCILPFDSGQLLLLWCESPLNMTLRLLTCRCNLLTIFRSTFLWWLCPRWPHVIRGSRGASTSTGWYVQMVRYVCSITTESWWTCPVTWLDWTPCWSRRPNGYRQTTWCGGP